MNNSINQINSNNNSCNSCSNSSSSSQDFKLNSLLFNDILPFLLYESEFEKLLELSLISKSTFNSIQNYVTNKQNEIKFYPKCDQLLYYIKSSSTSINSNKFKLFKFYELSNLYLNGEIEYYKESWYIDLKNELIKYCGDGLKKVYFPNYHYLLDTFDLDPTLNGFFQFNKLFTTWEYENPPKSNEDEEDEDDEDDNNQSGFSFEFLNRINPKKFKFSTTPKFGMSLHLLELNNILKCKSLESIKFDYHNTFDQEFIVNAISSTSPQIKVLSIRPDTGYLSNCFIKSNIANNKTLFKLVLRRKVNVRSSNDIIDPSLALEQLIGNTSIRILGLELYQLMKYQDYKLLSPLIHIPNISELYCDLDSVVPFLLHCNQNSNIKILQIKNYQNRNNKTYDNTIKEMKKMIKPICKYFSTFIKQNQSLECIKITACFDLYDRLTQILNRYKQQSNNNLIIKKYSIYNKK